MGDLIELQEHRHLRPYRERGMAPIDEFPWMNTLIICFGCTERWIGCLEGDLEGRFPVNKIECPYCCERKGVAIAEIIEQHWRAMREVEMK